MSEQDKFNPNILTSDEKAFASANGLTEAAMLDHKRSFFAMTEEEINTAHLNQSLNPFLLGSVADASQVQLDAEDREICRMTGTDPAAFLKTKREQVARGDLPAQPSTNSPKPATDTESALSADDLEVCLQTGVTPAQFAATREAGGWDGAAG